MPSPSWKFALRGFRHMITFLSGLSLVAISAPSVAGATPENAAQGDGRVSAFYDWSATLPASPGRLLRTEVLPTAVGLTGAAKQFRILYTSTDGVSGRGIVPVSGALFLPKGTPPAGGWPVIAWAHGTVGIADICAPSWAGRSYRDVRYLNAWLAQGYAVLATDYQGLGVRGPHPYINTRPEAYSVLDSVRAVLSAGYGLANKVVVVGQSQGGGAAVATAGFASAYAAELNLLGAVATGVPNLSPRGLAATRAPDMNAVDPTLAYMFYIALTAQQQLPMLRMEDLFTQEALPLVDQARNTCVANLESAVRGAGLTRAKAIKAAGIQKAILPLLGTLIYPTLKFRAALFIGTGGKDTDVSPEGQIALARDICAAGSIVAAHYYPDRDHSGTVNASLNDSLPFVAAVFAGKPVATTCLKE